MTVESWSAIHAGTATDRRAAVQREEQERAAARQERLASQTSPLNSPADRIRIWEELHALKLPQAPAHKLVRIIARQTDLSVHEVHQEQLRRAGRLDEPPAAIEPGTIG